MRTKSISIKSQCNSRTLFVCHKKLQILVHARSFLGSKVQKSTLETITLFLFTFCIRFRRTKP